MSLGGLGPSMLAGFRTLTNPEFMSQSLTLTNYGVDISESFLFSEMVWPRLVSPYHPLCGLDQLMYEKAQGRFVSVCVYYNSYIHEYVYIHSLYFSYWILYMSRAIALFSASLFS